MEARRIIFCLFFLAVFTGITTGLTYNHSSGNSGDGGYASGNSGDGGYASGASGNGEHASETSGDTEGTSGTSGDTEGASGTSGDTEGETSGDGEGAGECSPNSTPEFNRTSRLQHPGIELVPRIVGGEEAKVGEFPFMVSLGKMTNGQFDQQCGGSIVSNKWVLTAGHCFYNQDQKTWDKDPKTWYMKIGAHDISVNEASVITVQPHAIKIFDKYAPPAYPNDIALVELPNPLQFNSRIQPISLNKTGAPAAGTQCIVAGWGQTSENGPGSSTLLKVQLSILKNKCCGDLDPGMMCAGIYAGGKDSCGGDSGGPLVCPVDVNGKKQLQEVGVVSFGRGCARPGQPGVYTKVAYFINWIQTLVPNLKSA